MARLAVLTGAPNHSVSSAHSAVPVETQLIIRPRHGHQRAGHIQAVKLVRASA